MRFQLYHLGGPPRGLARRVDAARALHAAVKRCLDDCYRAGGPQAVPPDRLAQAFAELFDGQACADSREEEEYRAAGLAVLAHYHADHLADRTTGTQVDLILSGEIGPYQFSARADRREVRSDGRIVYVLYTTARRPPTEGPLERDLQTGILQLLAEQREGRPVTIEVHALRARRVLIATKPPGALAELRDHVVLLASAIVSAASYPAARGRHCRWCHVRGVCPEWEKR